MRFEIKIASDWQVKFADTMDFGWKFDLAKGVWWPSLTLIEQKINRSIENQTFGASVDSFYFGFELFDKPCQKTLGYTSYRPRVKIIVSVGQLNWHDVKHLSLQEQLFKFRESPLDAVRRMGAVKRKPRDFDYSRFASVLEEVLASAISSEFLSPVSASMIGGGYVR